MRERVAIRPMRPGDLDDVLTIEESCFPMPWSRNTYLSELHQRDNHYLVATIGQALAGYLGVQRYGDEAQISVVATAAGYRRRGVAEALLKAQLTDCWQRDCQAVSLEVRVSNRPAIALYQKYAFRIMASLPAYYADNQEDAYHMVCYRRALTARYLAAIAKVDGELVLYTLCNDQRIREQRLFSITPPRERILTDVKTIVGQTLARATKPWSAMAVNNYGFNEEERAVVNSFCQAYGYAAQLPFIAIAEVDATAMAQTIYERYLTGDFEPLNNLPPLNLKQRK